MEPDSRLPLTLKPEPIGYIIFIILGVLISLPLLSILPRGPSAILPVGILLAMVWLFVGVFIFWIAFQRIYLKADRLIFRENFATRELLYADITKVELLKQMTSVRGASMPTYLLNFYRASSDTPFPIVPKPYSLKDLSRLLSTIHAVAPQASFDDLAQQMASGTFRP